MGVCNQWGFPKRGGYPRIDGLYWKILFKVIIQRFILGNL